jgi:protein-S-isoprenylcysteine O-methyltransferase Ste14
MDPKLLAGIFYYLVLYGTLATAIIPVFFFLQWNFFSFWQKHVLLFYAFFSGLPVVSAAAFYFTQKYWIFWYYAFPGWVQLIGLFLVVASFVVIKLAELSITKKVRFFYPLLKSEKFHLKITGLYKYVRHPIYAVFPWIILGAIFYTGQLVLLPVMIFNLIGRNWYAPCEEEHLKKLAIGDYENYKKHTPFRFYPCYRKNPKEGRA